MSCRTLAKVEALATAGTVFRLGKWTIRYTPPAPPPPPRPFTFTHDDYDGAPDMLDPRHGLGVSLWDCMQRIAELEEAEARRDV